MLSEKVILVTGGSSGIGKKLAGDLLCLGNKVIIASNEPEKLNEAQIELSKISPDVFSYLVDIGDLKSVHDFADRVLLEKGCPDVIVNCAGYATYQTFEEMSIEEIERLIDVNFTGAIRCAHYFIPKMILRKSGSIINIASIAGKVVLTPNCIYSASKHGMVAWSEALRSELARFNINVSVVCPGRVETSFFEHETFKSRTVRSETKFTITLEEVSQSIIKTIQNKKELTYVPGYYSLLMWLVDVFRLVVNPLHKKLLVDRIDDMYVKK